ncbi:MAG: hypothetical protein RMZ43_035960, partial [Nostoc sp. CmiVER01]|uniref:hypothetical protein n=1 Tax=Nostoc sp. CmiVER01 TaxID=3075384 RepID=UPI003D1611ED
EDGHYSKHFLMAFSNELEFIADTIIIGKDDVLCIPTVKRTPAQGTSAEDRWDSQLWTLDKDGKHLWHYSVEGYIPATPVLTEEGTLYFSCLRNPSQDEWKRWMTTAEVHALNMKTGGFRWVTRVHNVEVLTGRLPIARHSFTAPVLGLDGTVYVGAAITEKVVHPASTTPPVHSCLIALRAHEPLATSAAWPIEDGNVCCSGISPLRPQ